MKAVGLYRYLPVDDPECLVDVTLDDPEPAGRDLLVRVRAVSVNPVDTKVRAGGNGVETEPKILGWDASGVVEAVGPDVSLFSVGDEVFYAGDITRPGCNSELHLVDERIVGRKPVTLSFEDAAALPLTSITAWEALFDRLRVDRSEGDAERPSVLIIGGAGGVGSIAIQIAKQVAGLAVVATASRQESAEWCRQLGADEVIDPHAEFRSEFDRVDMDEVDYVLCFNSLEEHFGKLPAVIRPQGAICTITTGREPLDLSPLFSKSIGFMFELMFTRPRFQTADMQKQHELLNEIAHLVDAATIRTTRTVDGGSLTAANLRKAHATVESGQMIGKLVLSLDS